MVIFIISLILTLIIRGNLINKKREKMYQKFIAESNGKNIFCYNNRKNSKEFIELNLTPKLPKSTEVIFLNGKLIESEINIDFAKILLSKFKKYNRFPHLIKIRDKKIIDKSINNLFYNTLNSSKSKKDLMKDVYSFFDIKTDEKT
jgi:hypothetical protein